MKTNYKQLLQKHSREEICHSYIAVNLDEVLKEEFEKEDVNEEEFNEMCELVDSYISSIICDVSYDVYDICYAVATCYEEFGTGTELDDIETTLNVLKGDE